MLRQNIFPVMWKLVRNFYANGESRESTITECVQSGLAHFLYFSTFFLFGMSVGMAGPTLADYLISFFEGIDVIDALSWLLFTQAMTRFIGAIFAGFLADR